MNAELNLRRWWALALLSAAQFLVILDTSIIGIALPDIQEALGFSSSSLQWVFNAYVIAFGGLLLLGGRTGCSRGGVARRSMGRRSFRRSTTARSSPTTQGRPGRSAPHRKTDFAAENRGGKDEMTLTRGWIAGGIAIGLIVLLVSACGGGDSDAASDATPSGAEFDRAFIDAMVPHHEGAIEMAQAAKDAGLSQPDLLQVADDILATQQAEIDLMKGWRGEWFGSSTSDPKGAAALGLSESQMGMQHDTDALAGSGDVDTAFAQMMITHHEGAITMAKLAADNAEHDELKELAEDVIDAQEREIDAMRPHASGAMDHG